MVRRLCRLCDVVVLVSFLCSVGKLWTCLYVLGVCRNLGDVSVPLVDLVMTFDLNVIS